MLNILGYGSNSNSKSGISTSGVSQPSPFAQMLTQLQQLENSNPKRYSQVSQQISTNLSGAASNAQGQGNSKLANQLTTLSKDFAVASQTGQLPDFTHLAKMLAGGQHNNAAPSSSDPAGASTAGATAVASSAHSGLLNFVTQALNLVGI